MKLTIKGDAYTLVACIVDELNAEGKDAAFSFSHPSAEVESNLSLHRGTIQDVVNAASRVDCALMKFQQQLLDSSATALPNLAPPEESPPRIDADIIVTS